MAMSVDPNPRYRPLRPEILWTKDGEHCSVDFEGVDEGGSDHAGDASGEEAGSRGVETRWLPFLRRPVPSSV